MGKKEDVLPYIKHLKENILSSRIVEEFEENAFSIFTDTDLVLNALSNHRLLKVLADSIGATEFAIDLTTYTGVNMDGIIKKAEAFVNVDYKKSQPVVVNKQSDFRLSYGKQVNVRIQYDRLNLCFSYSIVGNNCGHVCLFDLKAVDFSREVRGFKKGYLLMRVALDMLLLAGFSYVTLSSESPKYSNLDDDEREGVDVQRNDYLVKNGTYKSISTCSKSTDTIARFFGASEERFYNNRSTNPCIIWGIHLLKTVGIHVDDKLRGYGYSTDNLLQPTKITATNASTV